MLCNPSLNFFVTLTSFIKKSNKKSDQPLIFQAFSHACSPTYKLQLTKKNSEPVTIPAKYMDDSIDQSPMFPLFQVLPTEEASKCVNSPK